MIYDYEELTQIICNLETGNLILETMVLNGKNEKLNRYLKAAMAEIRHALSDLSDAEFEMATSRPEELE
ncbi:MAG: hypothetical protein MJ117_10480 [Lachnospiraceae bacterium]|nr:hypothetical protein [Lachnospiraceae bacterium]